MKIGFRVEGNENIGYGHLSRCYNLMEPAVAAGHEIVLISESQSSFNQMNKKNINITMINPSIDFVVDALIVDNYDISKEQMCVLKEKTTVIGAIDDTGIYDDLDFIINGNIYADFSMYSGCTSTKYLLGTDYLTFNNDVMNYRKVKFSESIDRILITMGGSDVNNYTITVMDAISNVDFKGIVSIIIGPGYAESNINDIKSCIDIRDYKTELYYNPRNLYDLMAISDLCIVASGSTVYELMAIGTPFIAIAQAENQIGIMNALYNLKVIDKRILHDSFSGILDIEESLRCFILHKGYFKSKCELINTLGISTGVERIIKAIEEIHANLV